MDKSLAVILDCSIKAKSTLIHERREYISTTLPPARLLISSHARVDVSSSSPTATYSTMLEMDTPSGEIV